MPRADCRRTPHSGAAPAGRDPLIAGPEAALSVAPRRRACPPVPAARRPVQRGVCTASKRVRAYGMSSRHASAEIWWLMKCKCISSGCGILSDALQSFCLRSYLMRLPRSCGPIHCRLGGCCAGRYAAAAAGSGSELPSAMRRWQTAVGSLMLRNHQDTHSASHSRFRVQFTGPPVRRCAALPQWTSNLGWRWLGSSRPPDAPVDIDANGSAMAP